MCSEQTFLLFGKSGWIGGLLGDLLRQQGARLEFATARLEDRAGVVADVERVRPWRSKRQFQIYYMIRGMGATARLWCTQVRPTHVLNAAGLTGRPNVDWCEDHKVRRPRICCRRCCQCNPTAPWVPGHWLTQEHKLSMAVELMSLVAGARMHC